MSKQLSRTTVARRYRLTPYYTIAFPRELPCIPDLHGDASELVPSPRRIAEFFGGIHLN